MANHLIFAAVQSPKPLPFQIGIHKTTTNTPQQKKMIPYLQVDFQRRLVKVFHRRCNKRTRAKLTTALLTHRSLMHQPVINAFKPSARNAQKKVLSGYNHAAGNKSMRVRKGRAQQLKCLQKFIKILILTLL